MYSIRLSILRLSLSTLVFFAPWSQAEPIPMKNCYLLYQSNSGPLRINNNGFNSNSITGGIQAGGWCQQLNGTWRWTDIDLCQEGAIWNENGRLTCAGWDNQIQQGT